MYIVIHNLYGLKDGNKAYFRKLGDCFDFVSDKKFAADLTQQECDEIMSHEEWYCKQYNASHMTIRLTTEEWKKQERSVTLTNDEWFTITTYIAITKQFCDEEQSIWEKWAEDGSMKNAATNAKFWKDIAEQMWLISQKIHNA